MATFLQTIDPFIGLLREPTLFQRYGCHDILKFKYIVKIDVLEPIDKVSRAQTKTGDGGRDRYQKTRIMDQASREKWELPPCF